MAKFELLPLLELSKKNTSLRSQSLPELVHLDDPAFAVMNDFSQSVPHTISPDETMSNAYNEMQAKGVHQLVVINSGGHVHGIIGTEDILGEKPIKEAQKKRIPREEILVKNIMVPTQQITAFNIQDIEHARVGNVVNTLKSIHKHYALVVKINEDGTHTVRGIFNAFQISKQLHQDIATSIYKAQSVSELQEREVK